ncbi:hypothetical protein GCM10010309_80610 [Streptomyces violaceochromogenes]|nr:hypothetical protein GCM10010309_80610 [Streptomyces violaceochromogenes]
MTGEGPEAGSLDTSHKIFFRASVISHQGDGFVGKRGPARQGALVPLGFVTALIECMVGPGQ